MAAYQDLFECQLRKCTGMVHCLGYVAHGQCWAMRLPLINILVHPEEKLCDYEVIFCLAYVVIESLCVPEASRIAHHFAERMEELAKEEAAMLREAMLKICRRAGGVIAEAWARLTMMKN